MADRRWQTVAGTAAVLVGASAAATLAKAGAAPRFGLTLVALGALALVLSGVGERLGELFGAQRGALAQATAANLPELFVVLFALHHGERSLAEAALAGSLLANGVLLLGLCPLVGSWRGHPPIPLGPALGGGGRPLLAVLAVAAVALAPFHRAATGFGLALASVVLAVGLAAGYLVWQRRALRAPLAPRRSGESPAGALLSLVLGGLATAFVSEWFVEAARPAADSLGLTAPFIGLIVVGIAGNAVEHGASVILAWRGAGELAGATVVASVLQVGCLLYPLAVVLSPLLGSTLTFSLRPLAAAAVGLAAAAVAAPRGGVGARGGVVLLVAYLGFALAAQLGLGASA